jgi:TonB family protein
MQKHSRKYVVLVFLAALTSGPLCLGKDDTVGPESLLAQAVKLQDVWSDGTPAVKVRAEIEALDVRGKALHGQYTVTWISASRWMEELEIANYKRIRVHDSKGYWQQSTLNFQPEVAFRVDSILDFKALLEIQAKQSLSKVRTRDKDGVRQRCTDVKWNTGTERVLCFDEASGSLLSVEYPRAENQTPPDISRVEYSAFNKLGDKRVPYEVRAFRGRTPIATIKVTDVTPITEGGAAPFAPPTNSEFWPKCDEHVQHAELVKRVRPNYPTNARSNGEEGRVIFYAVIETDGTLSDLTLIQPATPTLDSAAYDAVRQWRYKPVACGSTPIRIETSIAVDFWIQRP